MNGTQQGTSYFFTPSVNMEKQYAEKNYLYPYDVLLKKSISDSSITLPKSVYVSLIQNTPDYLKNYVDASEIDDALINDIADQDYEYSESDTELIANLCHSAGTMQPILDHLNQEFGYNHVIRKMEHEEEAVIPFTSNEIKINKKYDIKQMECEAHRLTNEDKNRIRNAMQNIDSSLAALPLDPTKDLILDEATVSILVSWQIENDVNLCDEFTKDFDQDELAF